MFWASADNLSLCLKAHDIRIFSNQLLVLTVPGDTHIVAASHAEGDCACSPIPVIPLKSSTSCIFSIQARRIWHHMLLQIISRWPDPAGWQAVILQQLNC